MEEYIKGGTQKGYYNQDEVEDCNCPLCQSENKKQIHTERGAVGIVKCLNCQLIYTSPRVKDAEMNYFGDEKTFYEEARLIFDGKEKHHRDRNYHFELKKIKKFKYRGDLLDIGSNMGFFLNKARSFGYEVIGVEPSPSLCQIARKEFKLNVINDFFRKEDFQEKKFDIITMIDVFEHVADPVSLLENAYDVLNEDGILCIKVPNGNYNLLKMSLTKKMGEIKNKEFFNAYEHLAHYTPKTISNILNRNGFVIIKKIIPLPIHPPVWSERVGHCYQHKSPFMHDWKRILVRKLFYCIGKIEYTFGLKVRFAPDFMYIIKKQ